MRKTLQDYKSFIDPVWCPGCSNYGVLKALIKALMELDIPPEDTVVVSGIGCSGRISHYLNSYSLHGTHGRALPIALGAKIARSELHVIVAGGDGDGLGIGGGHIPHAARKNVDITYLLFDNQIYGLTKGQASPTTPMGMNTKTSPYGVYEEPMITIPIFLAYDISFIALSSSILLDELTNTIKKAISHKGMSIVDILSQCRTYPVGDIKKMESQFKPVPDDHPVDNKMKAMELAYSRNPIYTGIYYQIQKPTLEDLLQEQTKKACKANDGKPLSLEQLVQIFS
ncbi:MAG: thiamine pyrophosphate-dependent enzyme [Candidatus Aminicenantaceae bacterium]